MTAPMQKSFQKVNDFGNKIKEYANMDVSCYVYVLYGGGANEMRINVVSNTSNKILDTKTFEFRQDTSLDIISKAAYDNGNLVALNKRNWNYTMVKKDRG